ncbi:hypothetical protein HDV00_008389, partial [Rhizophlyctis rosea]
MSTTNPPPPPDTSPHEPSRINLSDMDATRYAMFGSLFILAVDSSLFPLDTVKTLIMNERGVRKESIFRLIFRIGRTEAMYYTAYESAQDVLAKWAPNGNRFATGFVAGASAELAAGIFYVPADIVAQRLQVQNVEGFHHNKR